MCSGKRRPARRGIPLRQYVTEALEEKITAASTGGRASTAPLWMQGFGALSDLKEENRHVESLIAGDFEAIEPEDRA